MLAGRRAIVNYFRVAVRTFKTWHYKYGLPAGDMLSLKNSISGLKAA